MDLLEELRNNTGNVIKTNMVAKVTIDGNTDTYDVYKVRLGCLFFNDQNDRIATWISKYRAENGENSINRNNIEEYNNIIQSFIESSDQTYLKGTMNSIALSGQHRHGIVLNDGRVIDGNRRFTCLRTLAKNNEQFNWFETVILNQDYEHNAKAIKILELQVQMGEEERVGYNPIDRLVGIYRDIEENKLLTVGEYARSTNQKIGEVNKQLEVSKLLVEFLDYIKAPGKYYMAREMDLNGPLYELHGILSSISDEDKAQQVKGIVFTNLLAKPDGNMTTYIRKIKQINKAGLLDDFINRELNVCEEAIDSISDDTEDNHDTITAVSSNDGLRQQLNHSMDLTVDRAKARTSKEQPGLCIEKAIGNVNDIDAQVVSLLDEEAYNDFLSNIESLIAAIEDLKENVSRNKNI